MASISSETYVTADNVDGIREALGVFSSEQAAQLIDGCRIWVFENAEGFAGYITVWPDGAKAALASRAANHWGRWDEAKRELTLDNGDIYNAGGGVGEDA